MRLTAVGRPAEVIADAIAQQIAARQLSTADVCIVVSGSGANAASVRAAEAARSAGARVLALTSFASSPLADRADRSLVITPTGVSFREELAHTSRVAHAAFVEAFVDAVAGVLGERAASCGRTCSASCRTTSTTAPPERTRAPARPRARARVAASPRRRVRETPTAHRDCRCAPVFRCVSGVSRAGRECGWAGDGVVHKPYMCKVLCAAPTPRSAFDEESTPMKRTLAATAAIAALTIGALAGGAPATAAPPTAPEPRTALWMEPGVPAIPTGRTPASSCATPRTPGRRWRRWPTPRRGLVDDNIEGDLDAASASATRHRPTSAAICGPRHGSGSRDHRRRRGASTAQCDDHHARAHGANPGSGMFYNWYAPATGAKLTVFPTSGDTIHPFLSTVDNGWLATALRIVREAEPSLHDRADALYRSMDFSAFFDPAGAAGSRREPTAGDSGRRLRRRLRGGSAHVQRQRRDGLVHVSSLRHDRQREPHRDVPGDLGRHDPRDGPLRHASHDARRLRLGLAGAAAHRHDRQYDGVDVYEGVYSYDGMSFVPSWGGSMFESLMPDLFIRRRSGVLARGV